MTALRGRCPGCGGDGCLIVSAGGYITCSRSDCPCPTAVADILDDPLGHVHVVRFGERGFDIQHPLTERGEDLVECGLHQHVRLLDGPPVAPGRYVARHDGKRWSWSAVEPELEAERQGKGLGRRTR